MSFIPRREPEDPPKRQRKAHRKSRLGCRNCKLRSIKCDEKKPSCDRCTSIGYKCSYTIDRACNSSVCSESVLESYYTGAFQVDLRTPLLGPDGTPSPEPTQPPAKLQPTKSEDDVLPHVPVTVPDVVGDISIYELQCPPGCEPEYYQGVLSDEPSSFPTGTYGSVIERFGSGQEYLIHAFKTMAYLHDNDLALDSGRQLSAESRASLAYHWYHAITLYKEKLAKLDTLSGTELQGLWISCSFINGASVVFLESHDPYCVWPLHPDPANDLGWVTLNIAKRMLWRFCHPNQVAETGLDTRDAMNFERRLIKGVLPQSMLDWLGIDADSTVENNTFYGPAALLSHLIPETDPQAPIFRFVTRNGALPETFRDLLEQKDPRALMLVLFCYAKTCVDKRWSVFRRARVTGRSILLFLQIFHGDDATVQSLLEYPRAVFDLLEKDIQKATLRTFYVMDEKSLLFDDGSSMANLTLVGETA